MKKTIISTLALVTSILATSVAHAEPLTCGLSYHVKGGGLQVGIGFFELHGHGTISCEDSYGIHHERHVKIKIGGSPVAARVGFGYLDIFGASGSFGWNGSIDDLYGTYLETEVDAAVGIGVGTQFSVQNPDNGVRLSLGVEGSAGFGVDFGFSRFHILHDHSSCESSVEN
jgi:hypothetical protein